MKKKLYFAVLISIILSFAMSRRNVEIDDDEIITLYAASDSGDNTVTSIYMRDFADEVYRLTNHKVKVETFSSGSVGGDLELLESCREGNVTFVFQTSAIQTSVVKEAEIFDVPEIFDDIDQARNVIDNKIMKALKLKYEGNEYYLLGISDQGFRVMTSNKAVKNIDDFQGLKIRTMENTNHIEFWRDLGANPTPMSYSEVYVGLQQGIIDAQENPLEAIIAPKFYEQQKYLIETNHLIHPIMCIGSKKVLDKLPKEYKEAINQAAYIAQNNARDIVDERNKENIGMIENKGVKVMKLDSKVKYDISIRSEDLKEKIRKDVGEEFYDSIYEN